MKIFAKSRTISLVIGLVLMTLFLPGVVSAYATMGPSPLYIDQYGIKGDGSDEGAALQAALNYAGSHSITTVIFPAGKVITIGSLRIPEGLTLIGNGCTLKLKANSHTEGQPWTWIYVQEGVRVSGFKFDGNRFSGNGINTNGLMLQGNNVFDNNEVFNVNSYAVFVYGNYPTNIRITNNYIHTIKQYGIDTGGSDGPYSWGYNVTVSGNTIADCGEVGIKIRGTKDSVISNNKVTVGARNPGGDEPSGIRLYSWDEPNTNVVIANNIVTGIDQNPSACINSDDADNYKISLTGNKVSHCYDGIDVQFNNGIITGNTIADCVKGMTNGGSGNTVSNNSITKGTASVSAPVVLPTTTTSSSTSSTTSSSPPSITVTSPNGGEKWQRGTPHTVTWTYTGSPGSTVKIVVLKGSYPAGTIAESAPIGSGGKGSYTWTIYPTGSTGSDYMVSVQSVSLPTIKDTSNNSFTMIAGTATSGTSTTTKPSPTPTPTPSPTPTPVIKTNTTISVSGSSMNLDQYGIKGDGSDEGPKILSALNYAASHSITTVIFPAGKVITIGSLRIPEGLTLIGNGCTLKLKANSHTEGQPWTWIYVQEGVRVSGFKFDGNRFNGNGINTNGLMLQGNNVFDNNEVFNVNSYAVFVYGNYPKDIRITNNYIHTIKQYGIDTGGSDGPYSWGCNVTVSGNTIADCGEVGIKIRGTKDSVISNNKVTVGARNPGGDEPSGIRLYSWDEPNTNVVIANNIVTGIDQNPSACINSDDADNYKISITGNKVSHCYDGIDVQFNNGIITGNTIADCVKGITNGGSGNTVSNNSIT